MRKQSARTRLGSVLLSLVLLLSLLPVTAWAEGEAGVAIPTYYVGVNTGSASDGTEAAPFMSITSTIGKIQNEGIGNATIRLASNLEEDVEIPEGLTITLDLNGKTLTNKNGHTITNYGTLAILDSQGGGVVDNVTHTKGALYNKGTILEISGGTFKRSQEAGANGSGNGNSWYTVYNAGTIEKISGGTFENSGTFSSMLVNGWNNPGPNAHVR